MALRTMTLRLLLPLLISSIVFSGCAANRQIVLHPIEKSDIFGIPQGATVKIPAGSKLLDDKGKATYTWEADTELLVEKQGFFLSKYYLQEVANARAEK